MSNMWDERYAMFDAAIGPEPNDVLESVVRYVGRRGEVVR
jgi:hypothetical protein